jgi:hypothetical protein
MRERERVVALLLAFVGVTSILLSTHGNFKLVRRRSEATPTIIIVEAS